MGIFSNLRDKYIVKPVADRMLQLVQTPPVEKASIPQAMTVPYGFNDTMATSNKRMTSGATDFQLLRQLSIHHETTRAAINARKRQITQLSFDIADVEHDVPPQGSSGQQEKIRQMVMSLGGPGVRFRELLDKMIEDLLVLDAMAVYKQRTRGGQLYRLIPIDGSTIKLRVDQAGMRPQAPEIAFEQWIAGKKVAELTSKEMLYERMNPRNDSPYGLSPLESLVLTIDGSMRSLLYNLDYLSDNNVPQGFLQVPDGWNIQQIKEYKEWLDSAISGSKATAKVFPIPSGTTYQATSKPTDFQFKDFFDYLDRKVCMLFDIQPQELGLSLQQYKENAEGQERIQLRKGIRPLANFLEEVFTDIIRDEFGYPQFAFKFTGIDGRFTNEDAKTLIPLGVLGVDEVRTDRGLNKLGVQHVFMAGQNIVPVTSFSEQTTVSGSQDLTDETENPPDKQKLARKLLKVARNLTLESLEENPKYEKFKKKIKTSLIKQIKPFTQKKTIDKVTETEKVEYQNIVEKNVGQEMPTLQIYFDNDQIDAYLKWAAQAGGQNAYDKLGITSAFTLTSASFKRMLEDRSNYLIDSVDSTTKDWIIDQIVSGKELKLTNYEIAQKISDKLDEITSFRADMIVNTEVANAVGAAQVDTYRQQGVEQKEWITSEDNKVCSICEPMDRETVPVDEDFSAGVDHEPAHPMCRCFTEAVIAPLE